MVEFVLQVKNEIRAQLSAALQFRDQLNEAKDEACAKITKRANEIKTQASTMMYSCSSSRVEIAVKQQENK